jgi:hypothetical protein
MPSCITICLATWVPRSFSGIGMIGKGNILEHCMTGTISSNQAPGHGKGRDCILDCIIPKWSSSRLHAMSWWRHKNT